LKNGDELVWVIVMTESDVLWILAITMFVTLIWVIFFWDR